MVEEELKTYADHVIEEEPIEMEWEEIKDNIDVKMQEEE